MEGPSEPRAVESDPAPGAVHVATPVVLVPCQGHCPGAQTAGPITCEGACSALTTRWLAQRLMKEQGSRRSAGGAALLSLAVGGLLLVAPHALAAVERKTASYELKVTDPAPVKPGAKAAPLIRVVPKGKYHMNEEFPLKLKVSAPATASPRELQLTKKQVSKLTKAELVLKPEFTLTGAGRHAFKGTLRFSVCTDAQCEIKTEEVAWTAVSK